MSDPLATTLFLAPSIVRFLGRLIDDLSARRSVLLLLPQGVEAAAVWLRLQSRLWENDAILRSVVLSELPATSTPAALLGDALSVEWPAHDAPRTTECLSAAAGLPEVVHLDGLEHLTPESRRVWLSWLAQWAVVSHGAADRGARPTALLVIAPAAAVLPQVPESGPCLAVHWWWGFPSVLEMRLVCRLAGGDGELNTRTLWREFVLPAVAGSNVLLAAHLWDELCEGIDHLLARLLAFAEVQGWEKERLQAMGAEHLASFPGSAANRSASPPSRWQELYAWGAAGWTLEYGLELDTAALAALGRTEEVLHRVWRGQANLILPLIDQARLGLCDRLTRRHGPDWPLRWGSPSSLEEEEELRQSPLACGWGHLERLLRDCHHLSSERYWLPLSSAARRLRNELAHYRPVQFGEFESLWHEILRTAHGAPRFS